MNDDWNNPTTKRVKPTQIGSLELHIEYHCINTFQVLESLKPINITRADYNQIPLLERYASLLKIYPLAMLSVYIIYYLEKCSFCSRFHLVFENGNHSFKPSRKKI